MRPMYDDRLEPKGMMMDVARLGFGRTLDFVFGVVEPPFPGVH